MDLNEKQPRRRGVARLRAGPAAMSVRMSAWPVLTVELPPQSIDALQAIALVMVLSVVAGCIGYVLYRRSVQGQSNGDAAGEVFTLADLRELHRQGRLSDQEYKLAKARLLLMYRSSDEPASPDEAPEIEDLGHIGGEDDADASHDDDPPDPPDAPADTADDAVRLADDSAPASENPPPGEADESAGEDGEPRGDRDDGVEGEAGPR